MNDKLESLKEIKDIGLIVLEKDNSRFRDIERKSGIIIGWILALLGILTPIVIIVLKNFLIENIYIYNITLVFSILTAILFIGVLILSILSTKMQIFRGIDFQKIWNIEKKNTENQWDYNHIIKKLINHLYRIHRINKDLTDKKAKYVRYSYRLLFLGLVFLIILIIINIVFFIF